MPTPIHPEYILQSSANDAKQIQARAELDKPQPVVLRVLAVILAILVMVALQFDHSISPLVIGIITLTLVCCLQLAIDNWHTKRKLNAALVLMKSSH
jgi:uncharacterized membrane protein YoaK (UPF0700 family)